MSEGVPPIPREKPTHSPLDPHPRTDPNDQGHRSAADGPVNGGPGASRELTAREALGFGERQLPHIKRTQRPLTILMVEDNVVNQRVTRLLIESWGHTVTVASDGAIALEMTLSGPFDTVLMDMQMPVMDGVEAVTQLRRRESKGTSPALYVIAMTGNTLRDDEQRCLDAGMNDYVAKPINPAELFAKLEAVGAELPK